MNTGHIISNAWVSIGISFLVGLVLSLIFQSNWLPAFALGFAVTREVMSIIKNNINKRTNSIGKLNILKRFAS